MNIINNNSIISIRETEKILDEIPDIIKVFNRDHTIAFCNKVGYDFYKKVPNELKGEICYKMLGKNKVCDKCFFYKVLKNKKKITLEKYVPELNKIMDVCYNPILDEDGEVKFIIERLTDITEKKTLDKLLKLDRDRYEQILNSSPDPLLIIQDNKIILANKAIEIVFQIKYEDIIDSSINKYIDEKHRKIIYKRFKKIISKDNTNHVYDFEIKVRNKRISVQASCSYILYNGAGAILITLRDTSEIVGELKKAAQFQKNNLPKSFPAQNYMNIETCYVPSFIVSGDFYRIHKVNDELVVGGLIDVKGKGVTAALNISAFDLLFLQEVALSNEPLSLIESINKKLSQHYDENYIASCCFSLDFTKKQFKVVGAGINQFLFQKQGSNVEEKIIEGPFLGMFENSDFFQRVISIESGDRIFLVSDGLDFIFNDSVLKEYIESHNIKEVKKYIDMYLYNNIINHEKLKDDSTMIAIEIK